MKIPYEQEQFFLSCDIGVIISEFLDNDSFKNDILEPYRIKWTTHKSMEQDYFGDNNSFEDDIIQTVIVADKHIFDINLIKIHQIIKECIILENYELCLRLNDIVKIIETAINL